MTQMMITTCNSGLSWTLLFFFFFLILIYKNMSSTPTSATSATQSTLKPNDYNKGLDQEHITKLTQDAYRHFTEYTKAELKSKL